MAVVCVCVCEREGEEVGAEGVALTVLCEFEDHVLLCLSVFADTKEC